MPDASNAQCELPIEEQCRLLKNPVYFARTLCTAKLDPWQERVLEDCNEPGRTSVVAANGVGKTLLIATIIRFFLATRRKCRVVVISAVYRQLEMAHAFLAAMQGNFEQWHLVDGKLIAPNGNLCIWFATPDPGAVESQHSVDLSETHEGTLVLIRDECKSISSEVRDASERFGADWVFDFSSAGGAAGWFYDTQTKDRHLHRCHKATALDSSFFKPSLLNFLKEKYGVKHPFYLSTVMAEFGDSDPNVFIPLSLINENRRNQPRWEPGIKVAGIDLSTSLNGDECVICSREGNKILPLVAWHPSSPNAFDIAARCIFELNRLGISKTNVFADTGGRGSGIVDVMRRMDWPVIGVEFGGNPLAKTERIKNRMTEIWDNMKEGIERGRYILPDDEVLTTQLSTRMSQLLPSGRLRLETKEEMKARGFKSPDRADALALCLQSPSMMQPMRTMQRSEDYGYREDRVANGFVTTSGFDLGN